MVKKNKEVIELKKETQTSIIAVQRQDILTYTTLDAKTLDELYATVPEISRAIDLRGASLISRGFEIIARDDSDAAKKFASLCLQILNNSGGVTFLEGWQKNADLYGNGYVELVNEDGGDAITKLAHVHSYNFGYELEEYNDQGQTKTRVKLDKNTQEPIGYASYIFNQTKNILENNVKFDINRIAHLKFKLIGDALYGVSMVQPMYGSILRKLRIEQHIEDAARMVSSPKIIISGDFADDNEARNEAREAASLDVSDVVILQNGKDFKIINPGETSLPELREIFVTNITTACGIPRPILTSEGNDINKSTIQELMRSLRNDMRSDMNRMKALVENQIFYKIGETHGIAGFEVLIPSFVFPEDIESEEEMVVREERKAATLTSLSNSLAILNNVYISTGSGTGIEGMEELMTKTVDIYSKTIDTFMVNNDQRISSIEEDLTEAAAATKKTELSVELDYYNNYSMDDKIDTIRQQDVLLSQHHLLHQAFEQLKKGSIIRDHKTDKELSMMDLLEKHRQYVKLMNELGMNHVLMDVGKELDDIYYKLQE